MCHRSKNEWSGQHKSGVNEISMSHVRRRLDSPFSNSILVVSPNSTEGKLLIKLFAMVMGSRRIENAIVGMVGKNPDIDIQSLPFKKELTSNSVTGSSGGLVVDKQKTTGMIHKIGATSETIVQRAVT